MGDISIHAPHARSDHHKQITAKERRYFNPRSSCEERQSGHWHHALLGTISIHAPHARSDYCAVSRLHSNTEYFNPRSSCEERPRRFLDDSDALRISIHAPHARSDETILDTWKQSDISIHAPHARSDQISSISCRVGSFQSTLLMRGATSTITPMHRPMIFQSTLLMRGATRFCLSHAPCYHLFQSTLLMRGATRDP